MLKVFSLSTHNYCQPTDLEIPENKTKKTNNVWTISKPNVGQSLCFEWFNLIVNFVVFVFYVRSCTEQCGCRSSSIWVGDSAQIQPRKIAYSDSHTHDWRHICGKFVNKWYCMECNNVRPWLKDANERPLSIARIVCADIKWRSLTSYWQLDCEIKSICHHTPCAYLNQCNVLRLLSVLFAPLKVWLDRNCLSIRHAPRGASKCHFREPTHSIHFRFHLVPNLNSVDKYQHACPAPISH